MENEKYVKYYIEILTNTMNDCVLRNVSMQANAKITDDVVKEQAKKIENLSSSLKEYEEAFNKLKQEQSANENTTIKNLKEKSDQKDVEMAKLQNQLNELMNKYRDYDSVKSQITHIDTFKSELIKAREEILRNRNEHETEIGVLTKKHEEEKLQLKKQLDDLDAKIEYLQLTPAKRKKIDELNKGASIVSVVETANDDGVATKDGGSF